jgi:hypothetical protein
MGGRHAKPVLVEILGDCIGGTRDVGWGRRDTWVGYWHVAEVLSDPGRHDVDGGAGEHGEAHVGGNVVRLMKANKMVANDLGRKGAAMMTMRLHAREVG